MLDLCVISSNNRNSVISAAFWNCCATLQFIISRSNRLKSYPLTIRLSDPYLGCIKLFWSHISEQNSSISSKFWLQQKCPEWPAVFGGMVISSQRVWCRKWNSKKPSRDWQSKRYASSDQTKVAHTTTMAA